MDHKVLQPNPKFLYEENGAKVFFFHCICLSKDPKIPKRTQSPKNLCRHRVVLYLCLEHPSPKQLVESKVWSLVTGKIIHCLCMWGESCKNTLLVTFFCNFEPLPLARFSQQGTWREGVVLTRCMFRRSVWLAGVIFCANSGQLFPDVW